MKLRADLKIVLQDDYIKQYLIDSSGDKCLGCIFWATREDDNSMCQRINTPSLTCGRNRIYVIEEEQWNSYKEKQ